MSTPRILGQSTWASGGGPNARPRGRGGGSRQKPAWPAGVEHRTVREGRLLSAMLATSPRNSWPARCAGAGDLHLLAHVVGAG